MGVKAQSGDRSVIFKERIISASAVVKTGANHKGVAVTNKIHWDSRARRRRKTGAVVSVSAPDAGLIPGWEPLPKVAKLLMEQFQAPAPRPIRIPRQWEGGTPDVCKT